MPARPRFATAPTPGAKTWQQDVLRTAERLGTPMMPWQKRGVRLLAELSPQLCICHDPPRPLPRFKTVVASVPRQQGKTVLSRGAITTVAETNDNLDIFGTAQSRQYAARHVLKLGEHLKRAGEPVKVLRGVGAESITWPTGSTYLPISPTEGGGHGDSIDFLLVDEGWALEAHVMGGIRPALIARPHSQMLVISTMGTFDSHVWNRIVARGREAVNDPESTMAYIEFSAEHDEDVFDESKWHTWMPALGITVTREDIRSAIADMDPTEVVRAFGNRTVMTLVTVFPDDWVTRAWNLIEPPQRMVLAVDVNDSPAGAAVTSGHLASVLTEDGPREKAALRLIEHRSGSPRWVPELLARMVRDRKVDAIVADFGGPAREVKAEVENLCENRGVALVDRMPRDVAADTGRFYDALRNGTVVMEKAEPLVESIAGAVRKPLGDMWVVTRRPMSADASPVISAILAHGLAVELGIKPVAEFFAF